MTPEALAGFQRVLNALVGKQTHRGHLGRSLIMFQQRPDVTEKLAPLFAALSKKLLHVPLDHHFFGDITAPHRVPALLWHPAPPNARPPLLAAGLVAQTPQQFAKKMARVGLILRMSRLVWLDAKGGMMDDKGQLRAFFSGAQLALTLRQKTACMDPRGYLLPLFQALLTGGGKAISLCRLADLDRELFTYQGCGSFFSRQPYCHVRRLGLDDFERAATIIRQGEREGYLLARDNLSVSEVLAGSYGAFVLEGHMAGLCALQISRYHNEKAGEIISLYTLTRFLGAGVGVQLLRSVVRDAKRLGLAYLFACTQHRRVVEFFLRQRFGHDRQCFQKVDTNQVPAEKWRGYDGARKQRIVCLRLSIITECAK